MRNLEVLILLEVISISLNWLVKSRTVEESFSGEKSEFMNAQKSVSPVEDGNRMTISNLFLVSESAFVDEPSRRRKGAPN